MNNIPLLSSATRNSLINQLYALYPELATEQCADWLDILHRAQFEQGSDNTMLATAGTLCKGFMLLIDGSVRVYQDSSEGRELTLYRINPGDICLMSLNSLLHNKPFRANAKSDSCVSMLVFTADDFHLAMDVSSTFRNIMLSSLVNTVCTLVQSFYDTAFEPLDIRLSCLLGRLFERNRVKMLKVTHQELSQELGTSREVISRLLKKLEERKLIILKRGEIHIGENSHRHASAHNLSFIN